VSGVDSSGEGSGSLAATGLVDARAVSDLDGLDPWETRLLGVPLALWAARSLSLVLRPDRVRIAGDDRAKAAAARFGFGVVDGDRADETFALAMTGRTLGGGGGESSERVLIARPTAPFCRVESVRRALERGDGELTIHQTGPIERLRVRDAGELSEADAVARGLPAEHPALMGVRRYLGPGLERFRAVVTDVDGTLTDGRIFMPGGEVEGEAEPSRGFDTQDGLGMRLLMEAGFGLGVLSSTLRGESSRRRAAMLGVAEELIDVGPGHKAQRFLDLCEKLGSSPDRVIYFGDDMNCWPAMELAGLVVCPSDAHREVLAKADVVLESAGGRHAFRELADVLLEVKAGLPVSAEGETAAAAKGG